MQNIRDSKLQYQDTPTLGTRCPQSSGQSLIEPQDDAEVILESLESAVCGKAEQFAVLECGTNLQV